MCRWLFAFQWKDAGRSSALAETTGRLGPVTFGLFTIAFVTGSPGVLWHGRVLRTSIERHLSRGEIEDGRRRTGASDSKSAICRVGSD